MKNLALFALMAIYIVMSFSSCTDNWSMGSKTGTVTDFTRKGFISKTWEGSLFLTANGIKDMEGLEEKVMDMYGEQRSISEKLKPIDRRLKTLDEHISNAEKYMQYRSIYRQYKQQKPKKQEGFYEAHRMELTHYEAAARYLNGVMNGRTTLPTKAWKAERDKLNAERQQLSHRYDKLKNEVKEVEQIRRNVYSILRDESRSEQLTRQQDLDL